MTTLMATAILMGLGASLHCVGMCGPLVMAMPFQRSRNQFLSVVAYQFFKALAYGVLGLIVGFAGKLVSLFAYQQAISIGAGACILLLAFFPAIVKMRSGNKFLNGVLGKKLLQVQQQPTLMHFSVLGFLNGFLPCGLTYAALLGAAATATPFYGFLYMFLFGVGNSPMLAATAIFKQKMSTVFRRQFAKTAFIFSILTGTLLIARGLNIGIPYISPKMEKNTELHHTHNEAMNCH